MERHSTIEAPIEFTFRFVADYTNVPNWMFGITAFHPCGEQDAGPGATFDTSFSSGVASAQFQLTAAEWRADELIVLESVSGPYVRAAFAFAAHDPDATRLHVTITYPVTGGVAGRLLKRVSDAIANTAIRHVETSLRREVLAAYALRGQ
ncbi:hypothetical protein BOX37_05900 [Nocardia mangyaensis]|uniref:Polyketide cyclase n=1 Tax=Nocardia mangyaensis TaxID=2213200 RepID=A0A1J0W167_9NOCA|nr:hypothetical protein BOX37_05900 [Nocardia mangyaensis]